MKPLDPFAILLLLALVVASVRLLQLFAGVAARARRLAKRIRHADR